MRRTIGLALIGVGLSLALLLDGVSAAEPFVTAPAAAKVNEAFTITIHQCMDGEDNEGPYEAFIDETGKRPDGSVFSTEHAPSENGETNISETLSQPGTHTLTFECQHDSISNATTSTAWTEPVQILAEGAAIAAASLTAAERKACKKKKTAKKRKACLKREALD